MVTVPNDARVAIEYEGDIITARQKGRELAQEVGFTGSELTVIATVISEIARNIILYAQRGEMKLSTARKGAKRGIIVVARDDGPGIPSIEDAMRDGYSTGKGLGLGLPGAKRLMDEFEIASEVGSGTLVTMRKWVG
jgi:serine/threonine-protein kinase RsbT